MVESVNVASSHPVRQTLVQNACRRRMREFPRSLRAEPRSGVLDSTQGARKALESSWDRGRLEQGSFQLRARPRDDPTLSLAASVAGGELEAHEAGCPPALLCSNPLTRAP